MESKFKPVSQTSWDLSDLFPSPDSEELEIAFRTLEEQSDLFEAYRSKLTDSLSVESLLEIIRHLEMISNLGNRLYSYSSLLFTQDTQDQQAISLMGRVEQFSASLSNRLLFFSLWWKDLPDEVSSRLMEGAGDYRYFLEEMRHFKPHTLSEPEEKVINFKNVTGSSALINLYDQITNRYRFNLVVEGEQKMLSRGELMVYARHPEPHLRQAAYQELYRVYAQDGPILGQIYQNLVRDWHNEQVLLRNFSTPLAARNLSNDIPDPVVDTLISVCQRNAPIFQRYFKLKARWLHMDRLQRWDLYAPLAGSEKTFPFKDGVQLVYQALESFDPQFSTLAEKVFLEQHIDSEIRPGKRSGAFCLTAAPELTPWILLNYQAKAEDISTMAHELGHAIHAMLASHHNLFSFHASLPLAETASTFAEMALMDHMLLEVDDERIRRDMLFRQMDDTYATILRQSYFALFERQAHEMIRENASSDDLSEAYFDNLKNQFGDSVILGNEFRWEWVSIPHIYHTPFYVYAYSFGQLLVLSLYQRYLLEGDSFKPDYFKILASGGSCSPVEILANAGVDVFQDAFWQGGFNKIEQRLAQLEQIPIQ